MNEADTTARRNLLRRHGLAIAALLLGVAIGALGFGSRGGAPGTPGPAAAGSDQHAHSTAGEQGPQEWTCSMHPQIRQPEPGQCPICGMDLIEVQSGNASSPESGKDRVVLSERAKALMKLRTTTVVRERGAAGELRLLGLIEPNETTLKTVTAWTGGRIDKLHVNTTGQHVAAGQVIATLYSPEVFSAHQDLIVAKRQVERLSGAVESAQTAARHALEAARSRLRLLGVPDNELAQLEEQPRPTTAVKIRSPFGGTVMERIATEGSYIATGAPLFRIANLSSLWLQLDAYETDLPSLKVDQLVRVSVEGLDERFEGKVTFIDPTLDPRKRTAKVRVVVSSKKGKLRPGMFAEAIVEAPEDSDKPAQLVIPASAPLFTGRRALVYVEVPNAEAPTYEPRTVRLGPRMGDSYPVVAGLEEGERVVTRGAFALDADLQIRGGASMMSHADDQAGSTESVTLPATERKKLAPVMEAYLAIQKALAADDLAVAKRSAEKLESSAKRVQLSSPAEAIAIWRKVAPQLRAGASRVGEAQSIEGARSGFESLSGAAVRLLEGLGNPLDQSLSLAFCSMAFGSRGASWLQEGSTIDNAYFGEAMRSCGEIKQSVAPGAALGEPAGPAVEAREHGAH